VATTAPACAAAEGAAPEQWPQLGEQQCRSTRCCQYGRSDYIFGPKFLAMSSHIVPAFQFFVLFTSGTIVIRPLRFRSFSADGGNLPVNDE